MREGNRDTGGLASKSSECLSKGGQTVIGPTVIGPTAIARSAVCDEAISARDEGDCFVGKHRLLAMTFTMTIAVVVFLFASLLLVLFAAAPVYAQAPVTDIKTQVGFDQHPNAQLPLDLSFRDESGQVVKLEDYFGSKPVILTLNYFSCPNLCTFTLDQLGEALAQISFNLGEAYDVVTVSIDPREGPDLAAGKKWEAIRHYARPGLGAGWHFLTGDAAAISSLTHAVGFRYAYNAQTDEFAHPIGLVVLSPQGKIYRYLYGDDFDPTAIRLALVEASQNRIGTRLDQMLLVCYHYDPSQGTYSSLIVTMSQVAGLASVVIFGAVLARWWRKDLKQDAEVLRRESEKREP